MATEQKFLGWNSHRWSGWPGAYCMLCGCSDPVEARDDFPYPNDLGKATDAELAAELSFWEKIHAEIGLCPKNPHAEDPYTLGGFAK